MFFACCCCVPPPNGIRPEKLGELLKPIEEKSKLDRFTVVALITLFILLLIHLMGFAPVLVNFAGFGYPAYMSFKAIESEGENDDKQWLTYWVVFAFFNLLETFTDILSNYIPGYHYVKLVGLVLLFHPETKYAEQIYDTVIKPNFAKYVTAKAE